MQLLLESAAARCAAEVMTLNSAMSACAMLGENGGQAVLEDSARLISFGKESKVDKTLWNV